jgi:hypothetical protein
MKRQPGLHTPSLEIGLQSRQPLTLCSHYAPSGSAAPPRRGVTASSHAQDSAHLAPHRSLALAAPPTIRQSQPRPLPLP